MKAGYCQHCGTECQDVKGSEIWPDWPRLADKTVWRCNLCKARVGSHPNGKPLGTAANEELRRARDKLHTLMFDPIWKAAPSHPHYVHTLTYPPRSKEFAKAMAVILGTARHRTYRYLAFHLGLGSDECHVAMFDLAMCRAAWRALRGVTYADVRAWHYENPPEPKPPRPPRRKKSDAN